MILIGGVLSRYGARGGPISGVRTGLATPKKTTTPWPGPVCKASSTVPSAGGGVLPVVGGPHVAGRADAQVHLQLQAATDAAAGRRDRIAGLHAGRAVLGAEAAQLHDPSRGGG